MSCVISLLHTPTNVFGKYIQKVNLTIHAEYVHIHIYSIHRIRIYILFWFSTCKCIKRIRLLVPPLVRRVWIIQRSIEICHSVMKEASFFICYVLLKMVSKITTNLAFSHRACSSNIYICKWDSFWHLIRTQWIWFWRGGRSYKPFSL